MEAGLANTLAAKLKGQPVEPYEDAALADDVLLSLAKQIAMKHLTEEDKPLDDATAQMLIMAQGPKAVAYVSPELTTALRVSNATRTKDPMRLTGVPTKQEIKEAASDVGKRDKLKWKITGNGIKADAWVNNYGGD